MKYESKIYGHVEWPWWHDVLILGGAYGFIRGLLWLVGG
jgi:hypothetical protein